MVLVRFTDRSGCEVWDRFEIHESGDWVTFWGSDIDQRDTVPKERIKEIVEYRKFDAQPLPSSSGDGDLPSDWPLRRETVLTDDGYLCQNCWKKGGEEGPKDLEVHHIVPRGQPEGTHRLTNLTTLCEGCH